MNTPDKTLKRIVALYAVVIAVLALAAPGQVLRLVFPVLSVLVGLYLYLRDKPAYVGFTFWVIFITAFVRRLADNKAGYQESSPILVTPYLVLGLSAASLVSGFRNLFSARCRPILLGFAAVLYGLCVGLVHFPVPLIARPTIEWLSPLIFAFLLVETRDQSQQIRQSIERAFVWGGVVTGLYAFYQFIVLPPWDKLWLEQFPSAVFGLPEPMEVRAFSTMNAPILFGLTVVCMLMLALGSNLKVKAIAIPVTAVALLLTLDRSAWIAFGAAAFYYSVKLPSKERQRIVISFVAVLAVGSCLLFIPAMSEILGSKFATFTSLGSDDSFQARVIGYQKAAYTLAREPFGEGLGSTDILHNVTGSDDSLGPHDSTLLELLYSVGWLGTALYLTALIMVFYRFQRSTTVKMDIALQSIFFCFIVQSPLNQISGGGIGILLWTVSGLLLARQPVTQSESYQTQPITVYRGGSEAWQSQRP